MKSKTIAFIGGGNMATSIVGGLINNQFSPQKIWVSDPDDEQRSRLQRIYKVNVTENNQQAIERADIVVFAVKPQILVKVLQEVRVVIRKQKPLIISIVAGAKIASFESYFGAELAIIRTMPNTPALLGCGATALFANAQATDNDKSLAENIMRSVGIIIWFDKENKLNAATAVAGSGPAYFFLVMEAMQVAGESIGLSREEAKILVLETAFGAAKMALESENDLAELRRKVTSPGGTTEQAIQCFEQADLVGLFKKAITAADTRAEELSNLISNN